MFNSVLKLTVATMLAGGIGLANAATVGSLTWDGSSDYITSTEDTTVAYLQFGLLQGKTFSEATSFLSTNFPNFSLATYAETNHFANQLFDSSNPFPSGNFNLGFDYINDSLGATRSTTADVLWNPWGPGEANFGSYNTLSIDVAANTVEYQSYNAFDLTSTNNLVTGNNDSWLAVGPSSAIAAAVPEPETYAMFLAGLGLLGFASRNKQA